MGGVKLRCLFTVVHLSRFQYGVFTISWDSYHVADAIGEAASVVERRDPSVDEIARASQPFIQTFTGLFEYPSEAEIPTSVQSLVVLVQHWAQSWQRYVQRTLYGGKGLRSAIAQLRMHRHG